VTSFDRILIANRGEIARRIIRTLRRMGISPAAVYTDVDRDSPHVEEADVAAPLGGPGGYLDIDAVVEVARRVGARAVHPGYGFLAENASFARACVEAGVVFIGPPPEAIELMGDKINAKRAVAASGVPVVPGRDVPGLSDDQLAEAARDIGLPVLLKPSAGGGGKGMRLVTDAVDLAEAIAAARREAKAAFGDSTLLVERYVNRPRHIEMQVFADSHGHTVALGERECSLQRRHQKIVEEAPSPALDDVTRSAMAAQAVAAARACGYVGAGTVEFIVSADRPSDFYFMEMNTRLQVEHPVTELVLDVDLVEVQVRVAAGEELPWPDQASVPAPRGHSIEARVYAEDPDRGFLPSSGPVLVLEEPGLDDFVRVDSGIRTGSMVGTAYDPMLAKVIAWAHDRAAALGRLDEALRRTVVLGLVTNVAFLRRLLAAPEVVAGDLDTDLVERLLARLGRGAVPESVLAAAALLDPLLAEGMATSDPWSRRDGWRIGGYAPWASQWEVGSQLIRVTTRREPDDRSFVVSVGEGWQQVARPTLTGPRLVVEMGGMLASFAWAQDGDELWLGSEDGVWRLVRHRAAVIGTGMARAGGGRVTSPMPGKVVAVHVRPGDWVEAGQRLVAVEAMKMEHVVAAASAGTVVEVLVKEGDPVRLDQPLVLMDGSEP
jgi:acetyl-CoA/propionyl-CoA carboxylase biotin carboxyl carrier protein